MALHRLDTGGDICANMLNEEVFSCVLIALLYASENETIHFHLFNCFYNVNVFEERVSCELSA